MGIGFDFPQILSCITFFPMGVLMGYLMYVFNLNSNASRIFWIIRFWPFVVAAAFAILTAVLLTVLKTQAKCYRFEHFYVMTLGIILLLIGGANIATDSHEPSVGIYFGLIGHGILYISALSYINLRTSGKRFYKISFCHFFYLTGVAGGTTVLVDAINWFDISFRQFARMNEKVGTVIAVSCGIILAGYIANEILHWASSSYNYKKCLDPNMERENHAKQILEHKYSEIIDGSTAGRIPPGAPQHIETTLVIFSLFTRAKNIILFYYPFYMIHIFATIGDSFSPQTNFYAAHWFALSGLVISMGFISQYQFRSIFILSCVFKIIMLIVVTCSAINYFPNGAAQVLMWILFMSFGFGYSFSDLTILNTTSLKYNELILAAGYLMEIVLIGVINYYTIFYPNGFFNANSYVSIFLRHTISFGVIMFVLIIGAIIILPRAHVQCLLQIKNYYHFRNSPTTTLFNTGGVHMNSAPAYQPQQPYPPPGWNSQNQQPQYPGVYPPGPYPLQSQQQYPNQNYANYPPQYFQHQQHPGSYPMPMAPNDNIQPQPPAYMPMETQYVPAGSLQGVNPNVNVMKAGPGII